METGETTAEADEKILQPSPGGPRHLVASRRTRRGQADEKPRVSREKPEGKRENARICARKQKILPYALIPFPFLVTLFSAAWASH